MPKSARDQLDDHLEEFQLMDGYDDCIVGFVERFGQEPIVCYDREKVIKKLIQNGCDTYEGAQEYFEFNQIGGWHGELTPCFITIMDGQ